MKNLWLKISSFLFLFPGSVLAQTEETTGLKAAFPLAKDIAEETYKTDQNLNAVLSNVVGIILSVIGGIFVIFIVYAGYIWMTAHGNEQKSSKAKEIIIQSIIGLIVIIAAYAISYFVIKIFSAQIDI